MSIRTECTLNFKEEIRKMELVRECEICGNGTDDLSHNICPECRRRLMNLLYEKEDGDQNG